MFKFIVILGIVISMDLMWGVQLDFFDWTSWAKWITFFVLISLLGETK